MVNKTDTAKNSNGKSTSLASPEKNNLDNMPVSSQTATSATRKNQAENGIFAAFKRLGLSTKATLLAIAIGTLPVLGIGILAYTVANGTITKQISDNQQADGLGLLDKINRFIVERYGDIQVLSNLPVLANPRVREVTGPKEKQAVLDSYVAAYKVYDSIAVFDLDGKLLYQSASEPLANQKSREYFQEVLRNNVPFISQPTLSKDSGKVSIITAAPVKDISTGKTIAIVRGRIPVKSLEPILQNYKDSGENYNLIDASGKVFLSAELYEIGRDAFGDFPGLAELRTAKKVNSIVAVKKSDSKQQLVSYIPPTTVTGLPPLRWEAVVATDTATSFATQKELLLTIAIGTGLTALIVGAIAAWLAKRATTPILNATEAVEQLGRGKLNTRLNIQGEDELAVLGTNINLMATRLETLVKGQELDTERARSFASLTLRIRGSLKREDVLNTSVREVRQVLNTDRVVIYAFEDEIEWHGNVLAESVAGFWPKMTGVKIDDPCFRERQAAAYKNGHVRAISNIYEEPELKGKANCYIKMLEQFGVQASLIAPILTEKKLIGLLIAHQCEHPRIWEQHEIDLYTQVALQIGFALDQASLLSEVEQARQVAEKLSEERREQKEGLQMQLLELLTEVEGASQGDLTVRADVTAGEIGTVADFFNSIVESLRSIVTKVKDSASQVSVAIGSNEGDIRALASEALQQAQEINRTLESVDKMTLSIQAVADSAHQAASVARTASQTAEAGGVAMDLTVQNILRLRETVGETAKKVKRLGESSQQISRVVALINQIAMQTNLLAINAGIEAARAGEDGQGFAVVAEEVGELAARSAAATQEIEQIVENIQRETSEVVKAMEVGTTQVVEGTHIVEDAKLSLSQILDVSRQIDTLVQSISDATVSQVETSQAVSSLMKEIAKVSERTSDASRKVSQSLQQTVEISQELQATVGTFKVD